MMPDSPKLLELVEVTWIDSLEETKGWHPVEDQPKSEELPRFYSVGYLVKTAKEYITIAPTYHPADEDFHLGENMTAPLIIPKGAIIRVRKVTALEDMELKGSDNET